jgi:hypothetical protein
MPSKTKAQQRLFAAAAHGATFPKAKALRRDVPLQTLRDFATGPLKGKPARAGRKR